MRGSLVALGLWGPHASLVCAATASQHRLLVDFESPINSSEFHFGEAPTPSLAAAGNQPEIYAAAIGGTELCFEGNIVPQLYFLGAQKAATTTIGAAYEVGGGHLQSASKCLECLKEGVRLDVREPIQCIQAGGSFKRDAALDSDESCTQAGKMWRTGTDVKERRIFHDDGFFDNDDWMQLGHVEAVKRALPDGFPPCEAARPKPFLAADFSTYLGLPDAAQRIATAYGGMRYALSFGISLREPMSRLGSEYRHVQDKPFGYYLKHQSEKASWDTFEKFVTRAVSIYEFGLNHDPATLSKRELSEWKSVRNSGVLPIYGSMYGAALQRFLLYFRPQQFVIAPMLDMVRGDERSSEFMRTMARIVNVSSVEANAFAARFRRAVGEISLNSGRRLESEDIGHASRVRSGSELLGSRSGGSRALGRTSSITSDENPLDGMKKMRMLLQEDLELLVNLIVEHTDIQIPTFPETMQRDHSSVQAWLEGNW